MSRKSKVRIKCRNCKGRGLVYGGGSIIKVKASLCLYCKGRGYHRIRIKRMDNG